MLDWLFLVIILLFSVVIHEVSHGVMANYLGDPTAKYAGRLTLNPLKHLDPFGSVLLPLFMLLLTQGKGPLFGWAKPVPINPYNLKDQKYGSLKVAIAGPVSNLAIALVFGLALRLIPVIFVMPGPAIIFSFITYINILLAVFNLLPIPPLDGSHIFLALLPRGLENFKIMLNQIGVFILLFVIFFLFGWVALAVNWLFSILTGIPFSPF